MILQNRLAHLHPSSELLGIHPSERDVAFAFNENLPAQYHIFCNLDWARSSETKGKKTGEIDFIVATPGNFLHIIELSLGRFELDGNGCLVMKTPEGVKNKSIQLNSNKSVIIDFLGRAKARNISIPPQKIEGWLLLPNAQVSKESLLLRYPEDHIIDRSSGNDPVQELTRRILALNNNEKSTDQQVHPNLVKLLSQVLDYVPDVSTLASTELSFTARMQDLSDLILSTETNAEMIVIDGVAGSGKTQLALTGLNICSKNGRSACLVANTRVIPNLLRRQLGEVSSVYPFHEFIKLRHDKFDTIFVDEAHHFNQYAIGSIYSKLAPNGKLYALMDSAQNFDARFQPSAGATVFHFNTSYRVPSKLCDFLSELKPLNRRIRSPIINNDAYFDLHVGVSSLSACLDLMAVFFVDRPALLCQSGIVYCGSKYQLQEELGLNSQQLVDFLKICGISAPVETLKVNLQQGCCDIDSVDNPYELTIDTIRRWQGTSKPIIFVCNLDQQSTTSISCRLFYSAVTRSRSRCEVLVTPGFANQLISATEITHHNLN